MSVHECAQRRVSWRQTIRAEVIAASVGVQVQRYPMFAWFVAVVGVAHEGRRQSVYPSLGTTPRKIDTVRGSTASSLAICRVSISVVVDDVAALVYFQHGHELGVGDDVHCGLQGVTEMQLYAHVAILYQMEAGAIALVEGQVKTEEGVAVPVVAASQPVPLVLPRLAGRGE